MRVHTHAWCKCHEKDVCTVYVVSLRLALSILMFHQPSLLFPDGRFETTFPTLTSAPCRASPDPKARVKRTSARAARSLSFWQIPRTPQTTCVSSPWDGAIPFMARASSCLTSHDIAESRRRHALDACFTPRRAHRAWAHQSHTPLGRRASVQSADIGTWISPCNCGASTCLKPVKHNGRRLNISCSLRPSRYLVHTSAGLVWPAILAT